MHNLFEAKLRQALRAIKDYDKATQEYHRLMRIKPGYRDPDHHEQLAAATQKRNDLSRRIRTGKQRQEFKMVDSIVSGRERISAPSRDFGELASMHHALNSDILSTFDSGLMRNKKIAGIPRDINIIGRAEDYGIKLHGDARRNQRFIKPIADTLQVNDPVDLPRLKAATQNVQNSFTTSAPLKDVDALILNRLHRNTPSIDATEKIGKTSPGLVNKYANKIKHIIRSRDAGWRSKIGLPPPPEFKAERAPISSRKPGEGPDYTDYYNNPNPK